MATQLFNGARKWSMTRDDAGYRTYKISLRVEGAVTDGPANVLRTPGLPLPGTPWIVDDDFDPWSWCRPDATVTPEKSDEPNRFWTVEHTFSNKPPAQDKQRCHDQQIEDPLLEPQKISGTFAKYQEEAAFARTIKYYSGTALIRTESSARILTSSHEQVRGAQVEFDKNRPQVKIEQNVATLGLATFAAMIDTVNAAPLWGLPARCIKLTNASWERKFHGLCYLYYTRVFEFDINYNTFDRDLVDEGTKVLNGHWAGSDTPGTADDSAGWILDKIDGLPPDPSNPAHFIRAKDRNGENMRVILNGEGIPMGGITGTADDAGKIHVEKYEESDFLTLNIPTTF